MKINRDFARELSLVTWNVFDVAGWRGPIADAAYELQRAVDRAAGFDPDAEGFERDYEPDDFPFLS